MRTINTLDVVNESLNGLEGIDSPSLTIVNEFTKGLMLKYQGTISRDHRGEILVSTYECNGCDGRHYDCELVEKFASTVDEWVEVVTELAEVAKR